jgi:hypothetical protein
VHFHVCALGSPSNVQKTLHLPSSISLQVFCHVASVTVSQAAVYLVTQSSVYPPGKKSKGVISDDLVDHATGPPPSPNPFAWKLLIVKSFHWAGISATGRDQEENSEICASFSELRRFYIYNILLLVGILPDTACYSTSSAGRVSQSSV